MKEIQVVEIIEPLFEIMVIGNEEACIAHFKKYPELLNQNLNRVNEKMIHLASYYNLPHVLDYLIKQKVDVLEPHTTKVT